MIHQKAANTQSGSVIVWTLAWIAGMASIAWAAVTYAMPEFEKKQRRTIVRTVANMSDLPLSINIQGFNATLSGQVQNAETKISIINALGLHKGVFTVNDNLSVATIEQITDTPDGSFKFDSLVTDLVDNLQDPPARVPLKLVDKRQAVDPSSSSTDVAFGNESVDDETHSDSVEPSARANNSIDNSANSTVLPKDEQPTETIDDAPEIESATDTTPTLITTDDLPTTLLAIPETEAQSKPIDPISPSPGLSYQLESPVEPSTKEETESDILTDKKLITETKTAGIQLAELAIPIEEAQPSNPDEPEATTNESPKALIEAVLDTARSEVRTSQSNDSVGSATLESETPESQTIESEILQSATLELEAEATQALQQALSKLPTTQILFELGSAVLTSSSVNTLNQVADVLISFPRSTISIEGHTDATGESEANLALSLERAVVVRTYLISQGVSMLTLRAKGYGEDKPLASNETATGRATNRRIEFKF